MTISADASVPIERTDRIFIGGEWVTPSSGSTITVIDSHAEQANFTVAEAQAVGIDRAVTAARDAFDHGPWPRLTHAQRAAYLRALGEEVVKRSGAIQQMWPREAGVLASIADGAAHEARHTFDYYADLAAREGERTVLTIGDTITTASNRPQRPGLAPSLVFIGLVTAVLGSLGAPLVPTVAGSEHVSYVAAQWTLTVSMLAGAVTTPVFGKLGDGPRRKTVVLVALSIVLAGCVLAALPTGFFGLLAGRALQGFGIGLTALVIGVANEAFEGMHARAVAGLLSVTTVAGVGIGYPLAGLATHLWGLPGAYTSGAVVVGAALVAGALALPSSSRKKPVRTDILGAVLLAVAVGGLLFAVSQAATDIARVWVVAAAALGVVVGAIWVWWELRTAEPLVQLRLLRIPAVLAADVAMLLGGVGIYVLISVAIRLVQTPTSSGYGFGASVITAGLMLTPFSATAFVASRTIPPLVRRRHGNLLLPAACGLVLLCLVAFAFLHGSLLQVFVVMTIAGYGVGALYAATPGFIVRSAPPGTTTSAMSFNLVLTTIGGAIGSALSALVLQAATAHGTAIPSGHGYVVAAFVGAGVLAVAALLSYLLRPRPAYVGGNEPALAE